MVVVIGKKIPQYLVSKEENFIKNNGKIWIYGNQFETFNDGRGLTLFVNGSI